MVDDKTTEISSLEIKPTSQNSELIKVIEQQLVSANSLEEVEIYLKIYQEFIKQHELVNFYHYQQFRGKFQLIRQTSLWGVFISIGIALIISRLTIPGLILLAIVFYDFVFDYHKFRK